MAFPIRGQAPTIPPSAKWGVLCWLAPSQSLALYKTFLEAPKSGCETLGPVVQEDWIACLRGHLKQPILFLLHLVLEVTHKGQGHLHAYRLP